jgi:hypothetical protein
MCRSHKNHVPIVIALRTNDSKTSMPGATEPAPFDAAAFDALDGDIRAVFKSGEVITPSQVMGRHATLREAVQTSNTAKTGGWPTLAQARGKVIFLLDDSQAKADLYGGAAKSLDGRVMFAATGEASPMAAIIAIDDPVKDAARIVADVKAGFIVRTRADGQTLEARAGNTQRRDQAFASGAQIIQTDFLLPDKKIGAYQVSIGDPRHVRCDSAANPQLCAGWDIQAAPTAVTATAR